MVKLKKNTDQNHNFHIFKDQDFNLEHLEWRY